MGLDPGTRLGPYEVVIPLGAGGMGEVYRARDARLGRDVAIQPARRLTKLPATPQSAVHGGGGTYVFLIFLRYSGYSVSR